MRIISGNICSECCYCIDDYDGFGLCCRDNIYRNISINQHACRFFCGDGDNYSYHNNEPITDDDNNDEFYDEYDSY